MIDDVSLIDNERYFQFSTSVSIILLRYHNNDGCFVIALLSSRAFFCGLARAPAPGREEGRRKRLLLKIIWRESSQRNVNIEL